MNDEYKGFTFVVVTVIALLAGYYLDRWFGTEPWLVLIGVSISLASFVNLLRR